jgi:hypothetical protein
MVLVLLMMVKVTCGDGGWPPVTPMILAVAVSGRVFFFCD